MISPTDKTGKTTPAAGETTSLVQRGRRGKLTAAGRFADLLQSQAAGQSPAARTAAASPAVSRATGTRANQTSAAAMSSAAPAQSAGLSTQFTGFPVQPADLPVAFSPQAIERHMNQWLMNITRQQNEIRMQIYNNAVDGWKNTNDRNRELGLPEIPPPPKPELAEVAPMPEGWWFRAPEEA